MNRRSLLSSTAAGLGALLAGCSRTGTNASGNPTTTETTTDTPTTTTTETPHSDPATPTETTFRVVDSYPKSKPGGATVEFNEDEVRIHGHIEARSACYTAKLAGATLRGNELAVRVQTVKKEGVDACIQPIYIVEYEATVGVSGDGPETVVVVHDGEQVASVER